MHAKILFIGKIGDNCIREMPESDLQGSAIINQLLDIVANPLDYFLVLGLWKRFQQRLLMGDKEIQLINMNQAVAPGSRHFRIDLSNDHFRILHAGKSNIHRNPKAAETEPIWWTYLNQGHIKPDLL